MTRSIFQKPGLSGRPKALKKAMGGYLMVEVMVSAIIITVGIVGISQIQNVAKLSNEQAMQRSTAINLVDNLIERIRSNGGGVGTYFSNGDNVVKITGIPAEPAACSSGSVCIATAVADRDIYEWAQLLVGAQELDGGNNTGGLVNPIVCLQPQAGGTGIYTIAIAWHGRAKLSNQAITDNTTANNCGAADADNAYDEAGNDNVHRRVYWQEFFI